MKLINGFFLVNFIPFGIIILIGFILFFRGKYFREVWRSPLLFIFITLVTISAWRIPIIISRRYAMPTLVPGIVICTYVVLILPDILKKLRVKHGRGIVRILVMVSLIACVAKAMRFQESKPYINKLPKVLRKDCLKNNIKNTVLLILGKPGGNLYFDKEIKVINVKNKYLNDHCANIEFQLKQLDNKINYEKYKYQYPYLYLLCIEKKTSRFCSVWEKKYHQKPQLLYEYIRNKDKVAHRLYRITSKYKSAWMKPGELEELFSRNNILRNGTFSKKIKVLPNYPEVKILKERGIDLIHVTNSYLPMGWTINSNAGWQRECSPAQIRLMPSEEDNYKFQLKMSCNSTISLFSNTIFKGRQKYWIMLKFHGKPNSLIRIFLFKYSKNKLIKIECLTRINPNQQKQQQIIAFDLNHLDGYARMGLYLASGSVYIENIFVVPSSVLEKEKYNIIHQNTGLLSR